MISIKNLLHLSSLIVKSPNILIVLTKMEFRNSQFEILKKLSLRNLYNFKNIFLIW
jgi:hypothetical protein